MRVFFEFATSVTPRGLEAHAFQAWGEKPQALAVHPLRGSRFVSERLQTALLSLRLGGNVGLVDDIGLHIF